MKNKKRNKTSKEPVSDFGGVFIIPEYYSMVDSTLLAAVLQADPFLAFAELDNDALGL